MDTTTIYDREAVYFGCLVELADTLETLQRLAMHLGCVAFKTDDSRLIDGVKELKNLARDGLECIGNTGVLAVIEGNA